MDTESKIGKGSQSTTPVKIAKGLDEAIERFLKTEEAHLLGFRFKSDVANAAIRDLLMKFNFPHAVEGNPGEPSG